MTTVYLNRSRPSLVAIVTIDDEDGSATVDVSNEDTVDLLQRIEAEVQPGGYVEPWLTPLKVIQDWADYLAIGIEIEDQPAPWPAPEPGAVA